MEWVLLLQFGIPILLFAIGFFAGSSVERGHYRSLERRERETLGLPAVTVKTLPAGEVGSAVLVCENVVVSIDYFKRIVAGLRQLLGGQVSVYETLVDRARREAVLRMKERAAGSDIIVNVRIETSTLGADADDRGSVGSVEALAYGTAITLRR